MFESTRDDICHDVLLAGDMNGDDGGRFGVMDAEANIPEEMAGYNGF